MQRIVLAGVRLGAGFGWMPVILVGFGLSPRAMELMRMDCRLLWLLFDVLSMRISVCYEIARTTLQNIAQ